MPSTLELIAQGVSYDISDRLRYIHLGNDGLGMAQVRRETQQGPLQHGVTDRGFRLQPRTIQLVLLALGRDEDDFWDLRDEALYIFAPRQIPLQLRLTKPNGTRRQIDCHYAGDLRLSSQDRLGDMQRIGVQLFCPDPTWYDPDEASVSFEIAASDDAFNVPLAIPWAIGSSVIDQVVTVRYPGTWRAAPRITIVGPINNPVVQNLTTGEKLDFTGVNLSAGDVYTIDTSYGSATVLDQDGIDRTALLSNDSDLTTFHLASVTDVLDGLNDLRATGTAATSSTQIFVAYSARFLGI